MLYILAFAHWIREDLDDFQKCPNCISRHCRFSYWHVNQSYRNSQNILPQRRTRYEALGLLLMKLRIYIFIIPSIQTVLSKTFKKSNDGYRQGSVNVNEKRTKPKMILCERKWKEKYVIKIFFFWNWFCQPYFFKFILVSFFLWYCQVSSHRTRYFERMIEKSVNRKSSLSGVSSFLGISFYFFVISGKTKESVPINLVLEIVVLKIMLKIEIFSIIRF